MEPTISLWRPRVSMSNSSRSPVDRKRVDGRGKPRPNEPAHLPNSPEYWLDRARAKKHRLLAGTGLAAVPLTASAGHCRALNFLVATLGFEMGGREREEPLQFRKVWVSDNDLRRARQVTCPIGEAFGPAKRQCTTDRAKPFHRVFLLRAIIPTTVVETM
jgi:hypothetical protein